MDPEEEQQNSEDAAVAAFTEALDSDNTDIPFPDGEEQPRESTESVETETRDDRQEAARTRAEENQQQAQTPQREQKTQEQINWEARYKGLQRRYDHDRQQWEQVSQRAQELEQRNKEYEEALIKELVQEYPPEQQQQQEQTLRMAAEARRAWEATQQQQYALQQQEAEREERDRQNVVNILSQTYGVRPQEISWINDPHKMHEEAYKKGMVNQQMRNLQQQQQRAQSGADRFEGQGRSTPQKRVTDEDEATKNFARAMQKAGL